MTVHYEVTEQDYVNFCLYHINASKSGKRLSMVMYRIIPFVFFLIPLVRLLSNLSNLSEVLVPLLGSFFIAVIGALAFLVSVKLTRTPLIRLSAKMQLKDGKSNDFIGPQTITLHEDCIEDTNAQMATRINYSSIEKLCIGYDCLFIYIGALKGIIMPLRSFADMAQKNEFIHRLKQKTGLDVIAVSL